MSETLTSHTQWIQHAIAAAKAGNPSVAKIQLQKAAEEAPEDPAIWLWMGWLADSPASAAQCLELARSDARFEKIAVAGIEFAKALAEFQLDEISETDTESSGESETATDGAEQDVAVNDPVEAVEEVVAAVESLQQEDTTDSVADAPNRKADDTTSNEVVVEDRDAADNQQPESPSGDDVEAELMQSANELWQTDDGTAYEAADEASLASEEVTHDPQPAQELGQSTVDEVAVEDLPTPAQADSPQPAATAASVAEVIIDESEDDFSFASDDSDEAEFGAVISPPIEPSPINVSANSSLNPGDQWLGQGPVETPQAPVWRKAQSDWFSVDGPSEPEPEAVNLVEASPISATPVDQGSQLTIEHSPAAADSSASIPRVTASDVWQTAAIEKSSLTNPVVAQPPVYQPPVVQNSPVASVDGTSFAAAKPQSPTVGAVPAAGAFFAADARIDNRASGPVNAASLDQKTVLVVDDSPTVRKLVAITLEKRGYKVVSAFDGVAAIKEIAAHNPSLILMDVNMPRLDGYQLCKLVKKHETTCDIPVLMLTGKDGMFDRLRGRLVGCAGSIAKPFAPEELLAVVEQNILQTK
ncbi:MAG: twitching motility two-component system response regulator PilG [Planctomycetaceae bacterium]|jgi:twitching motility two-component system response regulator PilG